MRLRLLPALLFALGLAGCVTQCAERPEVAHNAETRRLAAECEGGSTRHCWFLAHLYAEGIGVEADAEHARELYDRSCGADGVEGCVELGRAALAEGRSDAALSLFRRGCAGRRIGACLSAMAEAEASAQPFLDETRAACRAGRRASCHALARAVDDVLPAPSGAPSEESRLSERVPREIRWTAMRCDRKAATMCTALAEFYLAEPSPTGITRDVEHARALASRACSDRNVTGCVVLGRLALAEERADLAEVSRSFERACDAGVLAGCIALADELDPTDSEGLARQHDALLKLCFTTEDAARCAAARALFE